MPDERFYSFSASTLRALDEARERLAEMVKMSPFPAAGGKPQIQVYQAQIEADWQKVYHLTRAVAQNFFTITPPCDPDFARAEQIGDALHNMTATTNKAGEVANAVENIMEIWTKTNPTKKA